MIDPSEPEPSNTPAGGNRFRLLAFGLGLLAASGVLSILLAEVVVRFAAPQQLIVMRPDLWQPVDTVGWTLRPGVSTRVNTGERTVHVYTDNEGFRVGAQGRREATTSVLLIGDSFAEAIQVEHEQTYAHLIEQGLVRTTGRDLVVRNAGVSDWNPNHYRLRVRQLLAHDKFDLLIVTVFVGNDAIAERRDHIPPREPVARHRFRLPRALLWREIVDAWLAPLNDGLEKRSHLFVLLKNQFAGLRMRLGVTADYLPMEFRRSEASSPRWALTAAIARDLEHEARAKGVPTLFFLIPERIQVYEEDFQRYLKGFSIDPALVDLEQPSRLLHDAFTAESLAVTDALPAFRAAAATGPKLFGTVDQHLSPEGHKVLADLVVPLASRSLVPR